MPRVCCQSVRMENPANLEAASINVKGAESSGHTTVESLAAELKAALPVPTVESLSIHDRGGDPIWMSGDVVGPDEHAVAIEAITVFEVEGNRAFVSERLTDDLGAAFFSISSPVGELYGVVMLVTDARNIAALDPTKLISAKVRSILQRLAIVMKPGEQPAARRSGNAVPARLIKSRPDPFESVAAKATDEAIRLRADSLRSERGPSGERLQTPPRFSTETTAAEDKLSATGRNPALATTARNRVLQPVPTPAVTPPAPASIAGQDPIREVTLHVQQLMKLRSGGRTRRYEVLVRAKPSAAGDGMDESLIKALSLRESAGAIDRMVVSELAKWLKANPTIWNTDPASFSVNLSLGSLLDPSFSRFVTQCLQSSGVAPDTIGFEIPESSVLKHRDAVARFFLECEKVGCYIVLDDFTMHQDVVPFLASRAVRVIKVDPNLTASAMNDRLSQAIVIAISQASKVLGLHCVAKRIESTASRQWLAAVGIDFAQGYAMEDPRPIESLVTGPAAGTRGGANRPGTRS